MRAVPDCSIKRVNRIGSDLRPDLPGRLAIISCIASKPVRHLSDTHSPQHAADRFSVAAFVIACLAGMGLTLRVKLIDQTAKLIACKTKRIVFLVLCFVKHSRNMGFQIQLRVILVVANRLLMIVSSARCFFH